MICSMNRFTHKQTLIPNHEFPQFMETMRKPLATTFRICGTLKDAEAYRDMIQSRYLSKLTGLHVDGEAVEAPAPIPWYPNHLGWHYEVSRQQIKKLPEFKAFHEFLVSEMATGKIARQEAVSMIPPLLVDVEPHHFVLDMCASPGSKTSQLVEAMHQQTCDGSIPTGVVIANDKDSKRTYTLVHNVKRLNSPCLLVTNNDASTFPALKVESGKKGGDKIQFDRILADVPCSGDGTARKNFSVWRAWSYRNGANLHVYVFHCWMYSD